MSRIWRANAIVLTLIATATPLAAQTTAEEALANYRELTRVEDDQPRCDRDADSDEIVVCGKDDSARHRLPLPAERGARDGARAATGEVPGASADRMRMGSCGVQSTDTGCTGGLPVIGAAILAIKAIGKIIDPDQ